ncbi:alpha-L-arabinofuranosidase, partial [candidate division KSB1 bacterium]|nr:alpha-L-arabinofuranosidase [candidate division KSB1 bacterium]
MKLLKIFATILLLPVLVFTTNNAPQITIDVAKPGAPVCSTMVGIFFEDINFGADGGLYPELVKNRSFEFDRPLRGWQVIPAKNNNGRVLNLRDENRPRNPRFLRILSGDSDGLGLVNEGFRGMGIRQGNKYRFSIYARRVEGNIDTVRVQILDNNGQILAQGQIHGFSKDWNKYQCLLTATATVEKAKMNLRFVGTGTLDVDLVSLFPLNTWNNRENGLRTDIVQLLADLKPGFLRFPGGCIVEGFDLSQRYQWKNTIGNPDERILNINRWNFEFKHRLTPDYYQTYGLGYYEFFQLAEDLNAEPMPILNCGMACQFNSAELVPMDQLHPYVQDALDLIEFANGSVSSEWGRIRAAMGHPKPFNMK